MYICSSHAIVVVKVVVVLAAYLSTYSYQSSNPSKTNITSLHLLRELTATRIVVCGGMCSAAAQLSPKGVNEEHTTDSKSIKSLE